MLMTSPIMECRYSGGTPMGYMLKVPGVGGLRKGVTRAVAGSCDTAPAAILSQDNVSRVQCSIVTWASDNQGLRPAP